MITQSVCFLFKKFTFIATLCFRYGVDSSLFGYGLAGLYLALNTFSDISGMGGTQSNQRRDYRCRLRCWKMVGLQNKLSMKMPILIALSAWLRSSATNLTVSILVPSFLMNLYAFVPSKSIARSLLFRLVRLSGAG